MFKGGDIFNREDIFHGRGNDGGGRVVGGIVYYGTRPRK